jgi:TatD DNase family protein
MHLFDTHTHLNAPRLYVRLQDYYQKALAAGVQEFVTVGYDLETSKRAIEVADQLAGVYAAIGIHPSELHRAGASDMVVIEAMLAHPKVVALGEVGLDYHWKDVTPDVQAQAFRRFIQMAKRHRLPLIIHSREAIENTYQILYEEEADQVGGVMHCFSSTPEMAQKFIQLNFYISLGGPVTFLNARVPKEVAKMVPAQRLLIETDSPYLAPHPHRGQINEPSMLPLIADTIATLRDCSYEELALVTTANARRLFQLDE